jgi:translation elongation factor P/translation initiation factor 5A
MYCNVTLVELEVGDYVKYMDKDEQVQEIKENSIVTKSGKELALEWYEKFVSPSVIQIRKNDIVLLRDHVCKVVDMSTSK